MHVRVKPIAHLVPLTIAILSTGCATQAYQAYPGPKLPRAETARIAADDASIVSVDGREVPDGRAFMLRAGLHAVSVTSTDAYGHGIGLMTFCLAAEGGANYQLRMSGAALSVPEVFDLGRVSVVPTLLVPVGQDCAPPPRGSTAVALLVPFSGRPHRGRAPPPTSHYPEDRRHDRDGSSGPRLTGPEARAVMEIPVRVLLTLLFCWLRR